MSPLRNWRAQLARLALVTAAVAVPHAAMAAFSLTTRWDGGHPSKVQYEIDTNAGLVLKIRAYETGAHTQSAGDISSLVFNGVQYQDQTRGSQLNSGFHGLYSNAPGVSVSAEMLSAAGIAQPASTAQNGTLGGGEYIKVTVTSRSAKGGVLKHYYLIKSGEPRVYMATYFTEEPDTLGMVRYIVRVPIGALPNGPSAGVPGGLASNDSWPQDRRGADKAVEARDVFGFPSSSRWAGQTRSKHYANMRLKDWTYFGGRNRGGTAGLWIHRDSQEGGSGGPFYRSLLNQITTEDNELTYIVNYGESQTEPFRLGVLDTYTLMFTDGSAPAAPDTRWFSLMGMQGYVPASGRGGVCGMALSGTVPGYDYTVGFSNHLAQYWATADMAHQGAFRATGMLPGSYVMTVYKNELAVAKTQVQVTAGDVTSLHAVAIDEDPEADTPVWRIGRWDGAPTELLNGAKVTVMHPSDVRMSDWSPGVFTVGSSEASSFPAYLWRDVNDRQIVRFNLSRAQLRDATLRIGITTAFAHGRPAIEVNGWSSSIPAASEQPTTRSLTVGTYRGNNKTFTFAIPASALVAGTNTLTIKVAGGSPSTVYLSPSFSIDAIDFLE